LVLLDADYSYICRRCLQSDYNIFVQSFVVFSFRLSLAFVWHASESLAAVTITGTRHQSIDKYFLSLDVYRIFVDRYYCLSRVTGRRAECRSRRNRSFYLILPPPARTTANTNEWYKFAFADKIICNTPLRRRDNTTCGWGVKRKKTI